MMEAENFSNPILKNRTFNIKLQLCYSNWQDVDIPSKSHTVNCNATKLLEPNKPSKKGLALFFYPALIQEEFICRSDLRQPGLQPASPNVELKQQQMLFILRRSHSHKPHCLTVYFARQ